MAVQSKWPMTFDEWFDEIHPLTATMAIKYPELREYTKASLKEAWDASRYNMTTRDI